MRSASALERRARPSVALALLLLVAWSSHGCRTPGGSPPPPDPDLSGYQTTVAKSFGEARAAVLSEPDSADAWGRFGEVLFAHNYFEQALVCFREAGRLDPHNFRWPYLAGNTLLFFDSDEALRMFERARTIEPSYLAAHLRSGRLLLMADRVDEARMAYERVLETRSNDSHALLGLALVDLASGETDRARAHLEQARRARPDHREVHAALATVYLRLGLDEEARESARLGATYSEETPMDDPVLEGVREGGSSAVHLAIRGHELLERGRIDEAIALLRVAYAERPDYFDVRVDLGSALVLVGEEDEGTALLRAAEQQAPDLVDAEALTDELRARRAR